MAACAQRSTQLSKKLQHHTQRSTVDYNAATQRSTINYNAATQRAAIDDDSSLNNATGSGVPSRATDLAAVRVDDTEDGGSVAVHQGARRGARHAVASPRRQLLMQK
jgi:hypothetical protein